MIARGSAWRFLPDREFRLCLHLNRMGEDRVIRRFFAVISRIGDGMVWYLLILGFALHDLLSGGLISLQLAVAGSFTLVLYHSLKRWTRRPRPYQRFRLITAHLPPLDEFSFPSGHTLHAVAFSTIAIVHQPWLSTLLLPLSLLIALSRVVLGLHYPSDVLAATAIGFAIAAASFVLI